MFLITNLLENLAIAFRGFRGFGPDAPLISLKELTLFTGKNGSGKSTFVKLLQMMANVLKSVHSMEDLMNLEINIGTDILGGADHLLYYLNKKNPRWVFSIGMDWYNFFEAHIVFTIMNKNILKLDSIQFYVKEKNLITAASNEPVLACRWEREEFITNLETLNSLYQNHATVANTIEALRYYFAKHGEGKEEYEIKKEINLNQREEKMFYSLFKFIKKDEIELTAKSLKDMGNYFINRSDSNLNYIMQRQTDGQANKPFQLRQIISESNHIDNYLYVYNDVENYEVNKNEVLKCLNVVSLNYRNQIDYFIEGQKTIKPEYDFAQMLMDKSNWLFESDFISASLLDSPDIPELHSSHFYINGPELREGYFDIQDKYYWIADDNEIGDDLEITNEQAEIELNDWYEENGDYEIVPLDNYYFSCKDVIGEVCNNIIREVMKPKYEYYQTLISKYRKIYEQGIIDFIKFISDISFQSNVVYGVERTYNIYTRANQYSRLLNFLDNQEKGRRDTILENLNKYLTILGIDKTLSYQVKENAGFIYLDNYGRKINLIDEGSGISKVIGLLFFILENIYNKENSDDTRLLVLEEPESNLHPSLQSKLADLFMEVLTNNNIRLLIETHSEYLIRRLQYLVGTNDIDPDKIGINYFQMKLQGKRKRKIEFYEINIGKDGRLSREFGPGFFDEADNLSVELFLRNKNPDN